MSDACTNYRRPKGVMGGSCLNCGCSQPEHVIRNRVPRKIAVKARTKLQELMIEQGFCPDERLLKFGESIVRECMKICQEAGADIENGDIFLKKEPGLLLDLKGGRWGAASRYAADEIKGHFGIK